MITELQKEVLDRAAYVLAEHERLRKALRDSETQVRAMCREYDQHFGVWGCAPHHLRNALEAQGLLDKAV